MLLAYLSFRVRLKVVKVETRASKAPLPDFEEKIAAGALGCTFQEGPSVESGELA
jgi:hypothetical protein